MLLRCRPSRYFSSLLLSFFLYLILHLCCAMRVRAELSLCFSLNWKMRFSLCFSMSNCLYLMTFWLYQFVSLSFCIVNFVCCECFISLMFCVMLIGSCDSCLLSGAWMVAMGPWGWVFELGKWTGKGNKSIKVDKQK